MEVRITKRLIEKRLELIITFEGPRFEPTTHDEKVGFLRIITIVTENQIILYISF